MHKTLLTITAGLLCSASVAALHAQSTGPEVIQANNSDVGPPLRDKAPGSERSNDLKREKPLRLFKTTGVDKHTPDAALQSSPGNSAPSPVGVGFDGLALAG